jgi:phosphoribosyl-ATP pyrophosphohydrolase/phosphoribosyl-AMP cyclohydrolase
MSGGALSSRRSVAAATIAGAVDTASISFDQNGLIPCIAQDRASGEVLMLAWANAEAIELTVSTGELHFFSRSRQEIWRKGATSGNLLRVSALRLDCDGDSLLALVEAAGPACHTGERTCFHNGELEPPAPFEVLPGLERVIAARAADRPAGSYTVELLDDPALIGSKVEEEAEEVARAAREETDERVCEESADLLYHLLVLMRSRRLGLADAQSVLAERRGA